MRIKETSHNKPINLKRKFISATAMLLISAIMLTMVSFAWLTMSVAPEVSGITTNIGANGSLEIALLTSETRVDLSSIKTAVGQSLVNSFAANNTWGNLVDLSDEQYGLEKIALLPARLSVQKNKENDRYTVNSGFLSVPTYGYDGRVVSVTENAITGQYNGTEFKTILGTDSFGGVRAIGTSASVTVQESALALAKTNILTYTSGARNEAKASIDKNINLVLMNIILPHSTDANAMYNDAALQPLKDIIASLEVSLSYVELSLKYGMVAVAASEIDDPDSFILVRDTILDSEKSLNSLINETVGGTSIGSIIPEAFITWVDAYSEMENDLNAANNILNGLTLGSYTWQEVREVMDKVMNLDGIFIGDKKFNEMSVSDIAGLLGSSFTLTLAPGSGIYAQLADFVGNIETIISFGNSVVDVRTLTLLNPVYLVALSEAIQNLKSADGSASDQTAVSLTSIYGYVIDLAFRCNAENSDLLLQTDALQRIYDESNSVATMGGGSYMQFSTEDAVLSLENTIKLMDAIRVAFVDDQGNVLGIAKLNTSNRVIIDETIKAPLYLYDYSVSEDEEDKGALIMGERRKFDNKIVSLERNVAKAVSAVVWIDGDLVDNTMVSAESETSIGGLLNLQFASSADLVPAENSQLLDITTDKNKLSALIDEMKAKRDSNGILVTPEGTEKYTTVSWNDFKEAYDNAVEVKENDTSTPFQVALASKALIKANAELATINLETFAAEIAQKREFMGKTTDLAYYILHNTSEGFYYKVNPYTEEQRDAKVGEIYRVNYENNLHDEGGGAKTPIYTDESWSNLAGALYDAELVYLSPYSTDVDIDSAINAMDVAYDALERRVFYIPYDYQGMLYYFAISEETDTYGKWYDPDFKRIVSDLTILELDAKAVPAEIAKVITNEYIKNIPQVITPTIHINDDIYAELTVDEILAVHWKVGDLFEMSMTNKQRSYIRDLIIRAESLNVTEGVADAETLLEKDANDEDLEVVTRGEAEAVIEPLEAAVLAAEAKDQEEKDAANPNMTPAQREVLTKALSEAKSIVGFSDDTGEEDASTPEGNSESGEGDTDTSVEDPYADIKAEIETIEGILSAESPTKEDANSAIERINVLLNKYGRKEVTEYNTILHTLPLGSEVFEVVNSVDNTMAMLYPTNDTYATSIEATVITRSGIVFNAKQAVTVYAPTVSPNVEIVLPTQNIPEGGSMVEELQDDNTKVSSWDKKMNVGTSTTLDLNLIQATHKVVSYVTVKVPVCDEQGNPVKDEDGNIIYEVVLDEEGNPEKDENGEIVYVTETIVETDGDGNIVYVPVLDKDGNPVLDENGNIVYDHPYSYGETIKSCTWSSDQYNWLQVTKNNNNSCTVTAVVPVDEDGNPINASAVTVKIRLSVDTHQGNTYTAEVDITVNAYTPS